MNPPVSENKTIRLMEVCGTHTMAIAQSGLKQLLPQGIQLISGPGCPVCVTPPEAVDLAVELSLRPGVTVCTYGDMLRVPGSSRNTSLLKARGRGASVEMVFSPMDALELARQNPAQEFVFLGVGFETTAPGTLAAVKTAREQQLSNFSVLMLLRLVEPALRTLLEDPENRIDGFLCPGHVAVITGEEGFRFLPEEYGLPAVIGGFETGELVGALKKLIRQVQARDPRLVNAYPRLVRPEGNRMAREIIREMTRPAPALWRGLGKIENSALELKEAYAPWDAALKFGLTLPEVSAPSACRCGQVISGRISPEECPFFGKGCTPDDPLGPCMVSSEGSCAAAYQFGG